MNLLPHTRVENKMIGRRNAPWRRLILQNCLQRFGRCLSRWLALLARVIQINRHLQRTFLNQRADVQRGE